MEKELLFRNEQLLHSDYLSGLVDKSYAVACSHGFHEEEYTVEHLLMLAIGEIGESVEADRCGRYANWSSYDVKFGSREELFRKEIKDSVGDELADVVIRLCDLCGAYGIAIRCYGDGVHFSDSDLGEFLSLYGDSDFCERCYGLVKILSSAESSKIFDDGSCDCLPVIIGSAIAFTFCMCMTMGIDLRRHIEEKMWYNSHRGRLHGKRY